MDKERLSRLILRYKAAYYKGFPLVTDEVYDKLEEQLKQIDPNNKALKIGGSDLDLEKSKFEKVKHNIPMLSLDKRYDIDELKKWIGTHAVVETPKIDGNSCSLLYDKGILVRAASRGRGGTTGFDLTDNVIFIKSVPKTLNKKVSCEVRGEVYMSKEDFETIKSNLDPDEDVPANARNYAAGTLRQENAEIVKDRPLSFLAYELISDELDIKTEKQKFELLPKLGFAVPPNKRCIADEVELRLQKWKDAKQKLPYEIDGIVYKYNDIQLQKQLGATSHHPRFAMAFKWESEKGVAKIEKIEWNTGRTGHLIPKATIEPIELSGATITHLTLHNYEFVRDNNVRVGSLIEIIRSGEVIPKFLSIIDEGDQDLEFPKVCNVCREKVIHEGVHLVCTNPTCEAQALKTLIGFTEALKKSGYEIDGLGKSIITGLYEAGLVKTPVDLLTLDKSSLAILKLSGKTVGEKTATKVIDNIQKRRKLPLDVFLSSLCIENLGRGTAERIVEKFLTIDKVLDATVQDFVVLEDFGEITAESVVEGLKKATPLINRLLAFIEIEMEQKNNTSTQCAGKSFVITGTLSQSRTTIANLIKNAGGKVSSAVSSKTDYLVAGEKAGSKLTKADKLGIKIISEEQLKEILDEA